MNNDYKKILNIKIDEEDYEKILVALVSMIQKLNNDKNNAIDEEDKDTVEFDIHKYKMLIGKLKTCRLYNE